MKNIIIPFLLTALSLIAGFNALSQDTVSTKYSIKLSQYDMSEYRLILPNYDVPLNVECDEICGYIEFPKTLFELGYLYPSMHYIGAFENFSFGHLYGGGTHHIPIRISHYQELLNSSQLYKLRAFRNNGYEHFNFENVKIFNAFESADVFDANEIGIDFYSSTRNKDLSSYVNIYRELNYFDSLNRDYYVVFSMRLDHSDIDTENCTSSGFECDRLLFHILADKIECGLSIDSKEFPVDSLPKNVTINLFKEQWKSNLLGINEIGEGVYEVENAQRFYYQNNWNHTYKLLKDFKESDEQIAFMDPKNWADQVNFHFDIIPARAKLDVNGINDLVIVANSELGPLDMVVNAYIYSENYQYVHRLSGEWTQLRAYITEIMKGKGKYSLCVSPNPKYKNAQMYLQDFGVFLFVVANP